MARTASEFTAEEITERAEALGLDPERASHRRAALQALTDSEAQRG